MQEHSARDRLVKIETPSLIQVQEDIVATPYTCEAGYIERVIERQREQVFLKLFDKIKEKKIPLPIAIVSLDVYAKNFRVDGYGHTCYTVCCDMNLVQSRDLCRSRHPLLIQMTTKLTRQGLEGVRCKDFALRYIQEELVSEFLRAIEIKRTFIPVVILEFKSSLDTSLSCDDFETYNCRLKYDIYEPKNVVLEGM
jgi:hypothetical protein